MDACMEPDDAAHKPPQARSNGASVLQPPTDEELVEQLNRKATELTLEWDPVICDADLGWLERHIVKLEKLTRTPELELRKVRSLKSIQRKFGGAPDDVAEMAKGWDEMTRSCGAQAGKLHTLCDELCTRLEEKPDDFGADEGILPTYALQEDICDYIKPFIELRTRLTVDAMAGENRESLSSFDGVLESTRLLLKQNAEIRQQIVSRKRGKVKKPLLRKGDIVYAVREAALENYMSWDWQLGTIISAKELGDDHGYGPHCVYEVHFHDREEPDEVSDYAVIERDYRHITRQSQERFGAEHLLDEDSKDFWVTIWGWFVVELMDKEEIHFASMTDAVKAHDANIIQRMGLSADGDYLNDARQWTILLTSAKDVHASEDVIKKLAHLRLQTIMMKELSSNSADMKLLGDALIALSEPNEPLMMRSCGVGTTRWNARVGYLWKDAYKHYMCGNMELMKICILRHAIMLEHHERETKLRTMLRCYIDARGDIDNFFSSMPIYRVGCNSTSSMARMKGYLDYHLPEVEFMLMHAIHSNGITREVHIVAETSPVVEFLQEHATACNTTIKSLRLKYDGRTVFLSNVRKKTLKELGMTSGDFEVSFMPSITDEAQAAQTPKPNRKHKKKKKHKQSNRKKSVQPKPPENEEQTLRKAHSKALSLVLEEADATFREIRQGLNAMNLERTLPKEKKRKPKPSNRVATEPVNNPPSDGLGGKAGKSHFVVQVGEVTNLYKTTKPSALRRAWQATNVMIDLHGLMVDEALNKLDESLVQWVEVAMRGSHPWVIAVKIVCGAGNQILSEAVEGWIKRNDQVAKAPKSMHT